MLFQIQPSFSSSPEEIVKKLDPGIREVVAAWDKDFRQVICAYATQKALKEKYSDLESLELLHNHFRHEAEFRWQFTKVYTAQAKATSFEEDLFQTSVREAQSLDRDIPMQSSVYDWDKAWQELRLQHAKQCWQFILEHQARCLEYYEARVKPDAAWASLKMKSLEWFAVGLWTNFSVINGWANARFDCLHAAAGGEICPHADSRRIAPKF